MELILCAKAVEEAKEGEYGEDVGKEVKELFSAM